jgi:hypothetical protein
MSVPPPRVRIYLPIGGRRLNFRHHGSRAGDAWHRQPAWYNRRIVSWTVAQGMTMPTRIEST